MLLVMLFLNRTMVNVTHDMNSMKLVIPLHSLYWSRPRKKIIWNPVTWPKKIDTVGREKIFSKNIF